MTWSLTSSCVTGRRGGPELSVTALSRDQAQAQVTSVRCAMSATGRGLAGPRFLPASLNESSSVHAGVGPGGTGIGRRHHTMLVAANSATFAAASSSCTFQTATNDSTAAITPA